MICILPEFSSTCTFTGADLGQISLSLFLARFLLFVVCLFLFVVLFFVHSFAFVFSFLFLLTIVHATSWILPSTQSKSWFHLEDSGQHGQQYTYAHGVSGRSGWICLIFSKKTEWLCAIVHASRRSIARCISLGVL